MKISAVLIIVRDIMCIGYAQMVVSLDTSKIWPGNHFTEVYGSVDLKSRSTLTVEYVLLAAIYRRKFAIQGIRCRRQL